MPSLRSRVRGGVPRAPPSRTRRLRRSPRASAPPRLQLTPAPPLSGSPASPGRPPLAPEIAARALRLGIPSKGRMAELTLELLNVRATAARRRGCKALTRGLRAASAFALLFGAQDCQMTVRKVNERQYVANMPNVRALHAPGGPAGAGGAAPRRIYAACHAPKRRRRGLCASCSAAARSRAAAALAAAAPGGRCEPPLLLRARHVAGTNPFPQSII